MADQSEVSHVEQEGNEEFYQILSDFIKRRDAGEEVDVEEYCKEHPEHASALRSYSAGDGLLNAMLDEADEKTPLHLRSSQSVSARGVETVRPGAAHATDTPMKEDFGRYRLVRMLGEGAMGAIYLAEDKNLEREVALKVPKLTGMEGADFLQRFSREAKAAARLDHPSICRVYDADEHEGTPYITMAFIDGQPLTRFIGTPEFDDQRRVVEMVRDIANGLEHAHQQKILHRDLKPGNVLVQPDGTPCITDFGLARRVDTGDESRITKEGSIIGTPAYMSPEQIEGHQNKIHATADVYSLGVIFYELLTKQLPFQGSVMSILGQAMRDRPKPISKTRGDVDPDLEQLCLKMLEKNNGDRPGSMKAIVDELDKWLQKTPEDQKATEAKVKRQKGQLEANKAKIQELIDRGQYAAAIKGLEKLAAIKNPNAKEYVAWAKKKLPEVRAMPETLQKGMASLVATADKFIERNDYAQAAELLSKIPPNQRTEKVQKLLDEAIEYQDEADLLLADLKDCVKRRQYKGIMDNLDRFLELKPGNKFANDLHRTLTTYGTGKRKKKKFRFDSKGRLLPAESGSIWDSFAVMGTLMFLVVFGGASWGIMIYLGDSDQQIAVKIDEQWLKDQGGKITLSVDGNEHTITGPGINIKVALGKRGFSVKNGDTVVYNPENFTIEKDGRKILHIDAAGMHFGTQRREPDTDQQVVDNGKPVGILKGDATKSDSETATTTSPGVIRQVSGWKYKSSIEGIKYKQLTPVDAMAVISHTTMTPVPLELGLIDGTPPNKGNNNNIHGHYEIPDFLRGACIFISPKNLGRLNPVTEFTVKKDATIYITCNWDYVIGPRLNSATGRKTEQEIIDSGWQPAGSMLRITGFHQKIFKRDVKAGETYKIQYDSASPPYVIVPSPDPGPKGTTARLIPTEDSDDLFIGPNIKKIVPIQQFLDMRKRPQFLEDFTYVKQPFSYAYFVVNRPCEVVLAARCDENDLDYWTEQDFNSKGWQDRGSTEIRVFGKPLTHTLFYKQCRPGELIWIRSRKTSPEIFVKPIGSPASSTSPPAVQRGTKVSKPEDIRQPSDWKVVSSIEGIEFQQVSVQEAKDFIACEMLDPIPLTLGKLTGGGPNVGISTISGGWYEIPAELRGAAIFQSQRLRGRISPITEFRVKKDGIIYLAAGSPRHRRSAPNSNREFDLFEQKMKNQKWEIMGSMLRISSQGSVCFRHRLYKKRVTAGEKYKFQSDSFVPPFVIVPSNNPGRSDVVTRWLPAPDSSDIVIAPGCRHIYRSDKSPPVLPVEDSEVLLSPPDSLKGTYYYKQQVPGAYAIVNKPCQVYVTIEPSPQHEKLWWTDADFAKDGWKKLQEVTAVRGENKIPQTLFMKTCKPGDVIDVAGDPIPRSFMFVRPLAN